MSIRFSIIIPTYNNANKLQLCLNHLKLLKFSNTEYEVIIVDNGSSDNTKNVFINESKNFNNIQYIYHEIPGLMAARHKGYELAKGDILCFIDEDSLVDRLWLQGLSQAYLGEKVVSVGGPIIPKYEIGPPLWLDYFWNFNEFGKYNTFLSLLDFGENQIEIPPRFIFGCNYSIKKVAFKDIGGSLPDVYPPEYAKYQGAGETGESHRISNLGKIIYHPLVKIEHIVTTNRMTIEYLRKRSFTSGIEQSYLFARKNAIKNSSRIKFILLLKYVLLSIKYYLVNLKYIFIRLPRNIRSMKIKISKSFIEGYKYHIKEIIRDSNLLAWISQKDYWGDDADVRNFKKVTK